MKLLGLKQETERAAKIKKIFWFFFWGSLVPIAAISGIVYFYGQTILQNQAVESLAALNRAKAEQLDLFIEKLKVRAADWSSDGRIRKSTELISQGESLSSDLSLYLRDKKLPIDPTVVLTDVLDLKGVVIASSDTSRIGMDESKEHISFPEASRALFGKVIFTPELVVEEDELAGVPMLHFASPLVSIETEKTLGVLLLHIKNDELNKVLAVEERKTLEIYLVNREKLMITPSRFIPNAVFTQSVDTPPVRACLDRGKDYRGSYLNYRTGQVIGVSKCIPDGLGVLITEIDASEAFASIIIFRNVAASAVAIILTLALIFAFFSGRRLLPTTTIIIAIIGVAFSLFFSKTIEQFVWRVRTESVFDLAQGQTRRHITDAKYFSDWQNEESQRRFKDFASELKLSHPSIVAIKIFNDETILIWSDLAEAKEVIGKKHEVDDVFEALEGKQKIESAEEEIQKQVGIPNLLEIYTPIFLKDKGAAVGVVEIYFDTSDLVAFIRRSQIFIWILIGGSLFIISSLLHFAFREQNRKIISQAKELFAIIEKSPIGIYTLGKDGIIESVNPRMVELAGFKNAKEIIGLNALELAAYKNCDCGLDKYLREGLAGKSFEIEVRHLTSDEKEKFQHYFGVPFFESDNKTVRQLLLLVEDITERKRLEAKILEYTKELERKVAERTADLESVLAEAQKLSAVVENSFEGVIIVDKEGVIRYVNPAWEKITGWSADEVIGKAGPRILKSGKHDTNFYNKLWTTVTQGQSFRAEMVNKRKDGSFYDVEVYIFPLKINDETMFVEISRDITEQKRLDEAKTSFISVASHQLRTPLSSMRWITEMFLSGDLGPLSEEQKSFIKDISVSNQRLINLVNALLASTRLEAGRVAIEPVPLNLLKSTKQILATLQGLIDAKQLKVTLNSSPPVLSTINLEPETFRQAVLNLISNAINYTANGGAININLELKEDHILFSVKDTGIGIPKKDQPRIFEKFFRADNAISLMPDGTGLGLSLARSLVLIWKGKIWFESEEGKGTTFFFTVPLVGMERKKGEVGLMT